MRLRSLGTEEKNVGFKAWMSSNRSFTSPRKNPIWLPCIYITWWHTRSYMWASGRYEMYTSSLSSFLYFWNIGMIRQPYTAECMKCTRLLSRTFWLLKYSVTLLNRNQSKLEFHISISEWTNVFEMRNNNQYLKYVSKTETFMISLVQWPH